MARFGSTVAMETTRGAKSSCRQSADALWVNPFKHDLLTSLFIYFSFSSEKAPHDAQIASAILYPVRGCRWKAHTHYHLLLTNK